MPLDYTGRGAARFTAPALLAQSRPMPILPDTIMDFTARLAVASTPCDVEIGAACYDLLDQRLADVIAATATVSATTDWQEVAATVDAAWPANAVRVRPFVRMLTAGALIEVDSFEPADVTAQVSKARAVLARSEAVQAKEDAESAEGRIVVLEQGAVSAANAAGDYAQAAFEHVGTASGFADAAGSSAEAASIDRVAVEKARDQAVALTGIAGGYSWLDGGNYWVVGDWLEADQLAAAPSVTTLAGTSIVVDASEGHVLRCSNIPVYFHERGLRARKAGQIVRATVRVRVVTDPATGGVEFRARQEQHKADGTREPNVTIFGGTQARRYSNIPNGSLTLTAADGWQTLTVEFDSDALMASSETHWRFGVFVSGGNAEDCEVGRITLEDVTAAKAEASITQAALAETNGRLSVMVGLKAEVDGNFASVKAFAFTDLSDPNATPITNILFEAQYYTFRGGLVLFENAELKSSNFVTGVSGWRIDEEGNAEFNSLISRSALTPDAVSDLEQVYLSSDYRWPETSLTERAKITLGVTEPTDLWLVHFAGKARGFGPQDAQGNVIEVRGLLYVQRRVKESGVWSAWETVDYFQSAYNPAVWQRFNFSENFAGDYEDVEYRVASAVPNGAWLPAGENNFSRISISARRPVR